jgi:threonine dehydratase
LSFEQRIKLESPVTTLIADGMACRVPDEASLAVMQSQVDEVLAVTDDEVADAMKLYFTATHNVAEGAGAAALAAALQIRGRLRGKKVGVTLSGGNVDHDMFADILRRPAREYADAACSNGDAGDESRLQQRRAA